MDTGFTYCYLFVFYSSFISLIEKLTFVDYIISMQGAPWIFLSVWRSGYFSCYWEPQSPKYCIVCNRWKPKSMDTTWIFFWSKCLILSKGFQRRMQEACQDDIFSCDVLYWVYQPVKWSWWVWLWDWLYKRM